MLGLIVIGLGAKSIKNMVDYDRNTSKAERINIKTFNKLGEAENELNKQKEKTEKSLIRLANRKKGILSTSIKNFIDLYSQIIKVNFKEGEGIKELSKSQFSLSVVQDIKRMINVASENLDTKQTVMTMVTKWGITGVISKEAEIDVATAQMRKKQANVIKSQLKIEYTALDAIYQRADRITNVLTKLNILFLKSIVNTKNIIEKNGMDRRNYSKHERESIQLCMNLASTIKIILDTPLLDDDGKIMEQTLNAIEIGESYLEKINNQMNS